MSVCQLSLQALNYSNQSLWQRPAWAMELLNIATGASAWQCGVRGGRCSLFLTMHISDVFVDNFKQIEKLQYIIWNLRQIVITMWGAPSSPVWR